MIVVDCEQLSPEWFQARCGIPSASNFDKIVKANGEPSKQRTKYLYQLASERIKGEKTPTYQSWQMKAGIEIEPKARLFYGLISGVEVQQVGICYQDERKLWSSSPDGLIGDDGGLEIKVAEPHVQVDRLFNGWSKTEHLQQVMGNLWITGRKWWDLISYSEGLPHIIIRFERDLKFFAKLKVALEDFCKELDEVEKKLREI